MIPALLFTLAAAVRVSSEPVHALLPVPASVAWRVGRLRLDSAVSVRIGGNLHDDRLTRAVTRFLAKPQGLLRITVIPALRMLVEAAGAR